MLGLDPPFLIANILSLFIALPIHEFAHAFIANAFGDTTPRQYGRLTLNPLAHLDVMGSLMMVVAGFGWAKPVPVNPYALGRRSPAALMWVSLAGPMSNLLLAVLAAIPLRLNVVPLTPSGEILPSISMFLYYFIWTNLALTLFNLIPLAPLDGDKISEYFAPPAMARILEIIRPYGSFVLIALMVVLPRLGIDVFGFIMSPAISTLWYLIVGG